MGDRVIPLKLFRLLEHHIAFVKDGGGKVLAEKLHFKLQLHWRPGGQTMGEPLFFEIYQYYILILITYILFAICCI